MISTQRFILTPLAACCLVLALAPQSAHSADDLDALSLESAPPSDTPEKSSPTRIFVEAAAGRISQRYGLDDIDSHRLSLDFTHKANLGGGWRWGLSNRLDNIRPAGQGYPSTLNSLREAYVGWQDEAGGTLVELGRINLRNGTAYGYNPTDIFRDGSLRAVTTADPLAQRENRMGTFMLRGQHIGSFGTVSLALAPKISDHPSTERFSIDAGSTNNRNRSLLTYSAKYSDRLNGQALLAYDEGRGPQWGANMTALLSDSMVAHAEWLRGRDQVLLGTLPGQTGRATRNRGTAGLTYASAKRLSITAEYEYNGFAPNEAAWAQAVALGPAGLAGYLLESQRRQEIVSRGAYLLYATQRDLFQKGLDLTALLRVNADDQSRLGWLELRYHWTKFDLAMQWLQTSGGAGTEYGLIPYRRSLQILGAYYF